MSLLPTTPSIRNLPVRHIRKNDGDTRSLLGGLISVKISTAETQGHFCVCEGLMAPNAAIPLHYHPDVEAFIVLDGSLDVFRVTDGKSESVSVQAGEMVLIPSNAKHGFCNRSERDARILILCTVGLEAFFEEASIRVEACQSTEIEPPKSEEIQRVLAIARKHGQVFADHGGATHVAF